jgi:hypothetical protein
VPQRDFVQFADGWSVGAPETSKLDVCVHRLPG